MKNDKSQFVVPTSDVYLSFVIGHLSFWPKNPCQLPKEDSVDLRVSVVKKSVVLVTRGYGKIRSILRQSFCAPPHFPSQRGAGLTGSGTAAGRRHPVGRSTERASTACKGPRVPPPNPP